MPSLPDSRKPDSRRPEAGNQIPDNKEGSFIQEVVDKDKYKRDNFYLH